LTITDFNLKSIGTGMPIIMLHGFQLDQTSLIAACEPILSDKSFRRIYLDLPGMGLNNNIQGIKTADDMINAVIEVIQNTIGDESFCLVGMSYGGYLARGIAHLLKDKCNGIFLFVPVIYPLYKDRTLPVHEVVYEDIQYTKDLDIATLSRLREMNVAITRRIVERQAIEIDEAVARGNETFLEEYQVNGYKASFDVDENSDTFNQTVMIVAGKQDSIVGYEDQFKLSQKYKRASYAVIDGAGHGLHLEKEEAFSSYFRMWLSEIEMSGPLV
jgi:pimeloyl-ACP methyl ester carboxylesterase